MNAEIAFMGFAFGFCAGWVISALIEWARSG